MRLIKQFFAFFVCYTAYFSWCLPSPGRYSHPDEFFFFFISVRCLITSLSSFRDDERLHKGRYYVGNYFVSIMRLTVDFVDVWIQVDDGSRFGSVEIYDAHSVYTFIEGTRTPTNHQRLWIITTDLLSVHIISHFYALITILIGFTSFTKRRTQLSQLMPYAYQLARKVGSQMRKCTRTGVCAFGGIPTTHSGRKQASRQPFPFLTE